MCEFVTFLINTIQYSIILQNLPLLHLHPTTAVFVGYFLAISVCTWQQNIRCLIAKERWQPCYYRRIAEYNT